MNIVAVEAKNFVSEEVENSLPSDGVEAATDEHLFEIISEAKNIPLCRAEKATLLKQKYARYLKIHSEIVTTADEIHQEEQIRRNIVCSRVGIEDSWRVNLKIVGTVPLIWKSMPFIRSGCLVFLLSTYSEKDACHAHAA